MTEEIKPKLKCILGNKVKLQNTKTMEISLYELVSPTQERLDKKLISKYTEIGQAIWSKEEGQTIEVYLPSKGLCTFKIIAISN